MTLRHQGRRNWRSAVVEHVRGVPAASGAVGLFAGGLIHTAVGTTSPRLQ